MDTAGVAVGDRLSGRWQMLTAKVVPQPPTSAGCPPPRSRDGNIGPLAYLFSFRLKLPCYLIGFHACCDTQLHVFWNSYIPRPGKGRKWQTPLSLKAPGTTLVLRARRLPSNPLWRAGCQARPRAELSSAEVPTTES